MERSVARALLFFSAGFSILLLGVLLALRELSRSSSLDPLGLVGLASGLAILFLGVGATLLKLQRSVVVPLAGLTDSIRRYAAGDRGVRSEEQGHLEIVELQSAFNRLAQSVEDSLRQLQRTDEDRTELISTLSHELRTPLTAIRGYAQLLRDEEAGPMLPDQRGFLEQILQASDRMKGMIDETLDAERQGAGAFWSDPARFVAVSLEEVLQECIRTVAPLSLEKQIEVELKVARTPDITGEPDRLRQVFLNLIANAVKYNRAGGKIEIRVQPNDPGRVQVDVSDTGIGMTEEEARQLFQKYFRSGTARDAKIAGTGLGLYLSRRWVEAVGGSIQVESRLGHGSVFRVELPIQPPIQPPPRNP